MRLSILQRLRQRVVNLVCGPQAKGAENGQVSPEISVFNNASTARCFDRVLGRGGPEIETVVDVGASNGSWTKMCMGYFPRASYLLVEAQQCHEDALRAFCREHANARYLLAAAGNVDGECFFDDSAPFGGLASNSRTGTCVTVLPMVRLDSVVAQTKLSGPYLLKLDTHGFELQIIQGAETVLSQCELAVIESYIFRLNDKALLFHELCMEMDRRGFWCIDFAEPLWRDKDRALWQWDLLFMRKNNPIFSDKSFK